MGRKRNPYIQLFTRDILSSPRCRALSEQAAGVYFFLLCRLNEPPTPGAYRISDWELHPKWKRSKTQQCLATADKYERLPYFAAMLSKNDLPWKQASILSGLQELYKYGIIVVEGDMLVQPRMYKDNRFRLPDLDHDGDPVNTILDDPASGSMAPADDEDFTENNTDENGSENGTQNGTKKVQKKVQRKAPVSHAPATRALSVEIMSNNNNSKGNKGGVGERAAPDPTAPADDAAGDAKPEKENAENTPQGTAAAPRRQAKGKAATAQRPVSEQPPTQEEVSAYWQERAEQGKPLLYISAEEFYATCETDGWTHGKDRKPIMNWKTFALGCDTYRRNHGDRPVGARPSAAAPPPRSGEPVKAEPNKDGQGKYRKW